MQKVLVVVDMQNDFIAVGAPSSLAVELAKELAEKIRELQGEIAERRKAEDALRETLERIARQQTAIAEIATHPAVFHGRLTEAAGMMTCQMVRDSKQRTGEFRKISSFDELVIE